MTKCLFFSVVVFHIWHHYRLVTEEIFWQISVLLVIDLYDLISLMVVYKKESSIRATYLFIMGRICCRFVRLSEIDIGYNLNKVYISGSGIGILRTKDIL